MGADGKPQANNGRGKKASERTTTTPSKRTLATGPGAFKAAETFQGTKPGYVFKLDKLGLGYYKDTQQLGGHNSDVSKKPPQLQKEKKGNKSDERYGSGTALVCVCVCVCVEGMFERGREGTELRRRLRKAHEVLLLPPHRST